MHELLELHTSTAKVGVSDFVITARGEIDMHTAGQLRAALDAVEKHAPDAVVLDLREVGFLDSAGLGVITGAAKRLRSAGADLRLVSDSREVLAVFRVTGLDRFLTIHATLAAAVDDLAVGAA